MPEKLHLIQQQQQQQLLRHIIYGPTIQEYILSSMTDDTRFPETTTIPIS